MTLRILNYGNYGIFLMLGPRVLVVILKETTGGELRVYRASKKAFCKVYRPSTRLL